MQEIFKEVLSKEEEAARIVKEAESRAKEIAAEAEKYYADTLKAAREESRRIIAEGSGEIRRTQEERVVRTLEEYERTWVDMREKGREKLESLAEDLARRIAEL